MGYFGNAFYRHRGYGQRGNLRVPRKVLRRILLDALKTTKIYWNTKFLEYSTANTSDGRPTFHIQCCQGSSTKMQFEADLLVAADGVRSSILERLYQSQTLVPSKRCNNNPKSNSTTGSPSALLVDEIGLSPDETNTDPKQDNNLPFWEDQLKVPSSLGLRYMGVRLILGIADFVHPLLEERGFYTLDGTHRLFTMPYESNRWCHSKKNRIMWQLSFSTTDQKRPLDSESLRNYALEHCRSWHDPVIPLIQATPLETIWGT